jgi:hypothetical protein
MHSRNMWRRGESDFVSRGKPPGASGCWRRGGARRGWDLFRVRDVEDGGTPVGTYGVRGDANKVLSKLAYESEPRW